MIDTNLIKFNLIDDTSDVNINLAENEVNFKVDLSDGVDKTYLHIQSIPSAEWIINHNLNKYPAVSVIDSANNEVIGEIQYIDNNNIKIKFAGSFSGKAALN